MQQQQIDITEVLFVDNTGLHTQGHADRCPRSLSHVSRQRSNANTLEILMKSITGLDHSAYDSMISETAVEWLCTFMVNDELEAYQLLSKNGVFGWWRNNWTERNEKMKSVLTEWYYEVWQLSCNADYTSDVCRKNAQASVKEKFTRFHRMIFNTASHQHRHLLESYQHLNK